MASIFDNIRTFFGNINKIAEYVGDPLNTRYGILEEYYNGDHRPQLKRKEGQQDENITQDYVGLAVDRSVSRLLRGGVDFVLPEGADKQQEYIDKVWELNKKNILLIQSALHAAVFGTGYIKIVINALSDPITGEVNEYPRLMALYPRIVRARVDPQDVDAVIQYIIEYTLRDDTREVAYRETTTKQLDGTWLVENWVKEGSNVWLLVKSVQWMYDFPPIIHWKNLPSLNSHLGTDDISDGINIQDKSNFVVSNTGKIIKFHATPTTIVTGVSAGQITPVDKSPNAMFSIPSAEAKAYNLEMQSDLAASRLFANDLKQSIFDVSREVDLSSVGDKLGQVTNFGLRVLYTDAIDKNDTKRQLMGEMLKELNRRLLVLAGYTLQASDPGSVQWGEALPLNIAEEMQADKMALDMGIVDVMTVAQKYSDRWGMDWEDLKLILEAENERKERARQEITGGIGTGSVDSVGGQGNDNGQDTEGRQLPASQ